MPCDSMLGLGSPLLELVDFSTVWFRNSQRPHYIPPESVPKVPPRKLISLGKTFPLQVFSPAGFNFHEGKEHASIIFCWPLPPVVEPELTDLL